MRLCDLKHVAQEAGLDSYWAFGVTVPVTQSRWQTGLLWEQRTEAIRGLRGLTRGSFMGSSNWWCPVTTSTGNKLAHEWRDHVNGGDGPGTKAEGGKSEEQQTVQYELGWNSTSLILSLVGHKSSTHFYINEMMSSLSLDGEITVDVSSPFCAASVDHYNTLHNSHIGIWILLFTQSGFLLSSSHYRI